MVEIAIVHFRRALLRLMPAHKGSDVIVVICRIVIVWPRHFFVLLAYNISVAPQGLSNDEVKRCYFYEKIRPCWPVMRPWTYSAH